MTDKALITLKIIIAIALIALAAVCGAWSYSAGFAHAEERLEAMDRELLPVCIVNVRSGSSLQVRQKPGTDSRVLHQLAAGAEVAVLDQRNGWALVNDPNLIGKRDPLGWVCEDYLLFDHKYVWSK